MVIERRKGIDREMTVIVEMTVTVTVIVIVTEGQTVAMIGTETGSVDTTGPEIEKPPDPEITMDPRKHPTNERDVHHLHLVVRNPKPKSYHSTRKPLPPRIH
jgi:hypothetical protein